jgi:SAM-dependent methyltransferase
MSADKIKKAPDYSSYAKKYAESRPGYPDELFKYLSSLVNEHNLVWDCATGNGQAALSLTEYFKKVIATDISSEQIKNATRHDRIEYKVRKADESGLENNSVDLVTVASAIHWFDLDKFYKEVKRVVKPGGVIAAWSYHVGYVNPPFDKLFKRFFLDVISPYFGTGAWLVDEKYSTINLPGSEIDSVNFSVKVNWNLYNLLNFIESWSATQEYKKEKKQNPVDLIIEELNRLWGKAEKINTLRWPLFLKISRL